MSGYDISTAFIQLSQLIIDYRRKHLGGNPQTRHATAGLDTFRSRVRIGLERSLNTKIITDIFAARRLRALEWIPNFTKETPGCLHLGIDNGRRKSVDPNTPRIRFLDRKDTCQY